MSTRRLAFALLAAAVTACGPPDGEQLRLTGVVQATPVVVRAPVAGHLIEAAFDEGRNVQAGHPLASLDPAAIRGEIESLEARIALLEARSRAARALAELDLRKAGDAGEDAAARLKIAVTQRDRAQKTVAEYDRNPPNIRRRVEAGRIVEERDQLGRLEAEWADARLSYFQLQAAAAEAAVRQSESGRQSAELQVRSLADPWTAGLLEERHRLNEARRRLEDHTVRAPVDGVVSVKVRSAGEFVARGDPIAVLYDPNRLWVAVSVEESIANGIAEGAAVEVELPGARRLHAQVESISPAASFATQRDVNRVRRDIRAFRLRLRLPDDSAARPGMTAYVRIRQ